MVDASATTDRAKEQVQEKAQVAQEKMQETADTVRSRVREQVDQRSTQAGGQVRSTAQALRSTSEKLREEGRDGPARAAERAADQAEKVGSWLEDSDADRILAEVEDFGRRQPMAVAAIGLAIGFAASRFLKASSRSRYELSGGYDAWARRRNPAYPGADRVPSQLGGGAGGVATERPVTSGVGAGAGTGPAVPPHGTNGLS